jgi:hypothetical protein
MRENGVKVVRVMWNTIVLNTLTIWSSSESASIILFIRSQWGKEGNWAELVWVWHHLKLSFSEKWILTTLIFLITVSFPLLIKSWRSKDPWEYLWWNTLWIPQSIPSKMWENNNHPYQTMSYFFLSKYKLTRTATLFTFKHSELQVTKPSDIAYCSYSTKIGSTIFYCTVNISLIQASIPPKSCWVSK